MPPTQDPNPNPSPTLPSSSPSSTTPAPPPPPNGASHNPPAEPHPPAHTNTTTTYQPHPRPLILALSGPTSSGKTSLATALHAIYPSPSSTLIHADDFYKPDHEIPFIEMPGGREERVRDWDCVGALDVGALEGRVRALLGEKGGGREDGGVLDGEEGGLVRQGNFEGVGEEGAAIKGISPSLITRLRSSLFPPSYPPLIILDGFLLFGANVPHSLTSLFDIKILLRATREAARERRERRNGYVTLEGGGDEGVTSFHSLLWCRYSTGREGGRDRPR
ncbi:P-loop containing nucleoside triphosphate hydrolase protein [Usnea florida]